MTPSPDIHAYLALGGVADAVAEPPCDYSGWDFDEINGQADELRGIRAERGVGSMLAHATGVSDETWRRAGGIDRPAGR